MATIIGCGPMRYRMVREGKISGYMSIRTRATDEEIAAVEPLYKALNAGRTSKRIHKGLVVRKGWLGKLPSLPLRWRRVA
ncbi:aerotaxis receptor protein [Escherichia coli]|uniref:Aerotaxis receptor protein n=1 Tax=Escherichia coli TaxID=562 RepID=A0A376MK57_ECOLX|nr:aerotaxis receptor protein [Escherichia coli]